MRGRILLAPEVYTDRLGGLGGLPPRRITSISSLVATGVLVGTTWGIGETCSEYAGGKQGKAPIGPGTGPIRSDPVRSGLRPVWTGLTILGSSIGGGPL